MLATEALADAVGFLGYYDLGGLKLTNRLFSDVADRCADGIRFFDFSNFGFIIRDSLVNVFRLTSNGHYGSLVCQVKVPGE